ncbi:MAG: ABC transporter permease [Acidovorax sp.]|nr:MAG: ABC transporter permease [Acidovorax sp.]
MSFSSFIVQLLNGLAGASSLFLVGAGLSLIFGVTRIVNFAHGSFFMVGIYVAYSLVAKLGTGLAFWPALLLAAVIAGALGAVVEVVLLRRIYKAPELFQLLATFALVLVIKDAALWIWGPEELLGPRAPGLSGSVDILGRQFPSYDLFLIVVGPVVLGLLWLLLTRTRWGTLVRAATQDREMVSALGVNQAWLFTAVFALGAMLAGLGGALQLPREPATLEMDLNTIGAAFVVVVVGGMGSIPGAYIAALLIAEIKAVCIWLGVVEIFGYSVSFSKLTLVVEFLVMAVVLVVRPWGLMGRPQGVSRNTGLPEAPLRAPDRWFKIGGMALLAVLVLLPMLTAGSPYLTVLFIDLVLAPLAAAAGALLYGWFCVRLSGVYLAMLTLAFAQITWAICYQWDGFTGGSNGLTGVWPAEWLADKRNYYYLTLALVAGSVLLLRRILYSPFGYALRAGRDSVLRADAIGIDVKRMQWTAFVIAGLFAGLGGSLFAFSKGSISPETLHVGRSVDGLVMVLLGGIQTLAGPVVGAVTFTWLHDTVARNTDYWRAMLGAIILILVLLFPQGIAGAIKQIFDNRREAKHTKEGTA